VACARARGTGHSAEQRSLWRAFDTSVSVMQKDFQAALTLKAQSSFACLMPALYACFRLL
jgi:hypothetical protein